MWLVGTESGSHASLLLGRVAVLLSRSATAEIDINSSTDLSLTSAGGRCELLALGLARLDLGGQIEGASAALLHGSMLPAPTVRLEVAGTIGVARRGLRSDRRAASAVHVPVCHGLTAPRPAFVTRNAQAHDCFDVSELTRTQAATARQRARQLGAGSACGGSEI